MLVVTDIVTCKQKMSPRGWSLFCEHRKSDLITSFNPERCSNDDMVVLTRFEILQYEYLA